MKTGPNDKSPAIPRLFSRGCGAIFFCFTMPIPSFQYLLGEICEGHLGVPKFS